MDKLSANLRRTLARDHRSTAWDLADLSNALQREIQVMDQDGRKKVATHSAEAFVINTRADKNKFKKPPVVPIPSFQGQLCAFCGDGHFSANCANVKLVDDRFKCAGQKGLCFNCLKPHPDGSPRGKSCPTGSCKICNFKHHTALHRDAPRPLPVRPPPVRPPPRNLNQYHVNAQSSGVLKTFTAYVEHDGKTCKASVLLDDGSTDSFCTERLARRLNLPSFGEQSYNIGTFGSKTPDQMMLSLSSLTLKTLEGPFRMKVVVVPTI